MAKPAPTPVSPARPARGKAAAASEPVPTANAGKGRAKGAKAPKPPKKAPRADRVKGRYGTIDLSQMGWFQRRRTERKYGLRKRNLIWRMRRPVFIALLAVVLGASTVAYSYWQEPLPSATPPLAEISFMCSAEVVVGQCTQDNSIAQLSGDEKRVLVKYDEVPQILVQAVLAAEDKDFFKHQGVDPNGIGRAFLSEVRNEDLKSGGSTITQQYIKNTYLTSERSLDRKIREAVLAIKIEKELPKKIILERYLNTIYFGRGAYGVAEASRVYFGKDLSQIGLPEASYLAGIIRSPEAYDPNRPSTDPFAARQRQAATNRRKDVLSAMVTEKYISQLDKEKIDDLGWDYVLVREPSKNYGKVTHTDLGSEYWIEYIRHYLTTQTPITDAQVFGGGLRIYTTMDWGQQAIAYDAIRSILGRPDDPAASIVSMDQLGNVRSMVGGFDFASSQVNLAAGVDGGGSGRQPGSSFKPFALAAALESGKSLGEVYSAPGRMTLRLKDGGSWNVGNYGDASLGTMNLVQATMMSSNTVYAQLINDIGTMNVVDTAKKLGVTGDLPEYPSVVLGTGSVSVLDMTTGFHTLSNHGMKIGPVVVTRVEDARGRLVWEPESKKEQVVRVETADAVSWVLNQVVTGGTGKSANYGQPAAGKTGTTENYRDAWFAGYSCDLTAAVWLGYPGEQTRYMSNVHGRQVAGGTFPTEIWGRFMRTANAGKSNCRTFPQPTFAPVVGATFAPGSVVEAPPGTADPTPGSTAKPPGSSAPTSSSSSSSSSTSSSSTSSSSTTSSSVVTSSSSSSTSSSSTPPTTP